MTSFTVKPSGAIKVKPTNKIAGKIEYYFKGMLMSPEDATIIEYTDSEIIVMRNKDQLILSFVKKNNQWLLKSSDTQKSLLYGTRFIYND
jgi:hypothetical protein